MEITFWFAKDNRLIQIYDREANKEIWCDLLWIKVYPRNAHWGLAVIR